MNRKLIVPEHPFPHDLRKIAEKWASLNLRLYETMPRMAEFFGQLSLAASQLSRAVHLGDSIGLVKIEHGRSQEDSEKTIITANTGDLGARVFNLYYEAIEALRLAEQEIMTRGPDNSLWFFKGSSLITTVRLFSELALGYSEGFRDNRIDLDGDPIDPS